eukprot:PITA_18454
MDVSYDCELNLSTNFEQTSFKEAASHDAWKEAMQKEYDALIKNDTWKLVDPPFGTKPIGCKWVYKNKYKADGSLDKHKARLVAKGFAQKEGVDYEETFTPTAKWATIRTLFALAAQNGWKVHQMDVKTAFLNGDLKENVFMSQPEGFAVKGHEHKVCKLVKSLYGLKQAPRAWYEKLTEHLLKLNFNHFDLDDATLFVKKVGKTVVYLVSAILFLLQWKKNLKLTSIEGKEFEDATKYRQLVGSLIYLTTTRLDISFAVGILSRFMQKPFPVDSTTEAEYVVAVEATKEIVWLRKILEDLQVKQVQSTPLMIDNTSALKLAKNPKFHDRTKHINTKYHLIRHHVDAKTIHLRHCSTNEQIEDIFTKALGREKLERFRTMLGLTKHLQIKGGNVDT